jgi:lysine-specific demethylase 3
MTEHLNGNQLSPDGCVTDNCDWLGVDNKFLSLKDANEPGNFDAFNKEWFQNRAVVVRNVHLNLAKDMWTPQSFMDDFGHLDVDLVNCKNSSILKSAKMKDFWLGFENSDLRLKDRKGDPIVLKLKDWPSDDEFERIMPERFMDLMKNLPISEYTQRDGSFNLVRNVPDFFLKPDLGPKLYIAYSSFNTPKAGTTNLHLDISDAVNVLIYVGLDCASSENKAAIKQQRKNSCGSSTSSSSCSSAVPGTSDEIVNLLSESNCGAEQIDRYLNGENIGAMWHIFLPDDAEKIRSFLLAMDIHKGRKILPNTDPIHDQTHYIDNKMLRQLSDDHGVHAFTIVQYIGDAVFIPAGAPHQVCFIFC